MSSYPNPSVSRKHSPKSKPKKDENWADIKDPEERRRVQNRLAQRKFRDKTKERKEREDREAEDRDRSFQSYETRHPQVMEEDHNPSGLPWGAMSLKPVFSRSQMRKDEYRRASQSQSQETQSPYQHSPQYSPSQYSPSQYSPSQQINEDPDQDGVFESDAYNYGDRASYGHQSQSGRGSTY